MFSLGPAQLDVEKQEITVGARKVALQRKPYLVLLYLIENRHRMVDRKELLDQFWEGKEVYDQSLSKAVATIRKAFGEPAGSELIETRWGLGYRYIGPFEEVAEKLTPVVPVHEAVETSSSFWAFPAAETTSSSKTGRRALFLLAPVALLAIAALVLVRARREAPGGRDAFQGPVRSLAVLPFTAASDDLEGQYLGLELSDTLATRLSSIPQLTVRPAATVRSIVGLEPDLSVAAKKLAVQSLVNGQVRQTAGAIEVSVELLDRGTKRWSETFKTDSKTLPDAENAIAQALSAQLGGKSTNSSSKLSSGSGTTDPEAYDDYMKARFFSTTRTRSSLAHAIQLLIQATGRDPSYARAFAVLADCYSLEGFYQYEPPAQAYPRAKQAALKALSLDPSLLEAHVSLLAILTDYDWDWKAAEREFKATIAIDPSYAVAYQYYGYTLFAMGRGNEGLVAFRHAAEMDPVSPSIQTSLAWGHYLLRQDQEGVEQCKRVLELYPDYVPARQLLGLTYDQLGMHPHAMSELKRAQAVESSNSMTPLFIDYELARSGHAREAAEDLTKAIAHPGVTFVPDYYVAAAWTAVGDNQKAEYFLDRAFQARSNWLIDLHYDPRFDALRSEAGFQALVGRIDSGVPPSNRK